MGVLLTQSSGSNLSHILCIPRPWEFHVAAFNRLSSLNCRDFSEWLALFCWKETRSITHYSCVFPFCYYQKKTILHFFFSDSAYRFFGNQTHTDYFKLLRKDGQSLLIGARNVIYNISLPYLTENVEQVRKKISLKIWHWRRGRPIKFIRKYFMHIFLLLIKVVKLAAIFATYLLALWLFYAFLLYFNCQLE